MKRWLAAAVVLAISGCGGDTAPEPPTTPAGGEATTMKLTSSAFGEGGMVPAEYTCDGSDVSPPLTIEDVPDGAAGLVLVMDDPDAPRGTWDHWVAYDIPVTAEIPSGDGAIGTGGRNSWGRTGYGGPCPPSGTHRYFFRLFAVSEQAGLAEGATKGEVYDAIDGTVIAEATLMGRYSRSQ